MWSTRLLHAERLNARFCKLFRSVMSSPRALASQPHGTRLQFPLLPPELAEKYKPGQMYRHQASLPPLPVPPLRQTLQKYVTSMEPLMTPEELEKTKAAVAEFGRLGGVGEMLQEKLMERARTHDNWLAEWWGRVAYMGFRLPVTVNVSPAVGYPRQPAEDTDTYVRTVARHLLGCVKWNLLIQTEAIPADFYRDKPMCMSQYGLYSKCRIPRPSVDISRKTPISESRHIMVARNGHFFKLDVLYMSPSGELAVAPSSHIMKQLHHILSSAPEPAQYPVGALTSDHRDTWYLARERLIKDPVNRASLDVIEQAQMLLCLDRAHPLNSTVGHNSKFTDSHSTVVANRCLHGNGTELNSCNRWFDSSVHLVMGEDGGFGTILEHSAGDGLAAIAGNIFNLDLMYIQKYNVLEEPSSVDPAVLRPAEQLQWNISPETAQDIETSKRNLDNLVADVDLQTFTFKEFGKNVPKAAKLSPDGFVQIAIQLAYYKLYNRPTAMYESGATRWFKYGRTDTIRSSTNASLAFVKAMCNPNMTFDEKANALDAAVKAHGDYTDEAIAGQAVDRHLLGLKILASEAGIETPEIFKDPAFARGLHFCLSTSQVPVPDHEVFLCFGAVEEDGYGVCYNPQETHFIFSVSSFRHCPETDSQLYASKLVESLREMHDVVVATKGISSKL